MSKGREKPDLHQGARVTEEREFDNPVDEAWKVVNRIRSGKFPIDPNVLLMAQTLVLLDIADSMRILSGKS